ncbi:hypothetical protein GCM10011610_71280 [Nocardia rhizosphaerihabitans]|uniref:Uncharacterized protein n=1 Tax=Nocardia rhizosphaerihabitans TaxID=1691570 RepID=A0ABQ2L3U4_9NOCA|nr:hypothetical protein GCM10011610_71280 [Nocardia rhizosphaerihabitans]
MALPDGCVDGLFVAESTVLFVSYLNRAFDNDGFPWPSGSDAQWRCVMTSVRTCCPCNPDFA